MSRLPRPGWHGRHEPALASAPPWVEAAEPVAAVDAPPEPVAESAPAAEAVPAMAPVQSETAGPAFVSAAAVTWAYRLLLGREPESAAIVRDHVEHSASLAELRERFLGSSEFTQHYQPVTQPVVCNVSIFPPCAIQTRVDAATAARLFERVARSWTRLGETEPYWSVLSEPDYLMQHIGETREAFLASGYENVKRLLATLHRNDITANPDWEVLELGCGLGRNTRFLAQQFRRIFAVDVSNSHLRLARKLNADAPQIDRAVWLPLVHPAGLSALPEFDLFFSMIVLQHNPPPVIGLLLETVADKLRPGGYAFFQVPTYQRGYAFDVESYLALRGDESPIEMHAFPQAEIFRIFRERGCVLLEVFEDGLSGHRDNHRSNAFLFHKPAADRSADTGGSPQPSYSKAE